MSLEQWCSVFHPVVQTQNKEWTSVGACRHGAMNTVWVSSRGTGTRQSRNLSGCQLTQGSECSVCFVQWYRNKMAKEPEWVPVGWGQCVFCPVIQTHTFCGQSQVLGKMMQHIPGGVGTPIKLCDRCQTQDYDQLPNKNWAVFIPFHEDCTPRKKGWSLLSYPALVSLLETPSHHPESQPQMSNRQWLIADISFFRLSVKESSKGEEGGVFLCVQSVLVPRSCTDTQWCCFAGRVLQAVHHNGGITLESQIE